MNFATSTFLSLKIPYQMPVTPPLKEKEKKKGHGMIEQLTGQETDFRNDQFCDASGVRQRRAEDGNAMSGAILEVHLVCIVCFLMCPDHRYLVPSKAIIRLLIHLILLGGRVVHSWCRSRIRYWLLPSFHLLVRKIIVERTVNTSDGIEILQTHV